MPAQAYALVQDAHDADADADAVGVGAIDDDVRADQVCPMCRRQVVAVMAKLRVVADRLERVVDLVAVGQKLILAPCFAGKTQDVDEILPRSW